MMKIGQLLLIALFAFFSGNAFAVSIVYNGLKCQSATNANDPTPLEIPVQSRFEVVEDVGGGLFRLSLTGGLPRFINNNQNVCIDSDTAIGFSGIPALDGLPQRLDAIDATGYFDGQNLVIIVNSINTDLSAGRDTFSGFTTSFVFPISNTLIFEHNPQTLMFKLTKIIHNRGVVHTSGSTSSIIPFLETVLPIFGDTEENKHKILIPVSNIEYILK
jgi:hypothetical protein